MANTEPLTPRLQNLLSFIPEAATVTLADQYSCNGPYPYVIIDNFFNPDVASGLTRRIAGLRDEDYRVSFRSLAQSKLQLGGVKAAVPDVYGVCAALMERGFARFIEGLSGFSDLQGDGQFAGAGLHRYRRGGFSEIHLDSNRHPFDADLIHRVNLLIFLTPNWRADWGGELILWSDKLGKPADPVAVIAPVFNRAVLFSVTDKSWHSVNPIKCSDGESRNSIAIYFYSRKKIGEDKVSRSVIWHSKRSKPRQLVFEVTNRLMTRAKPYAPYLRWLRPTKFDGVRSEPPAKSEP